MESLQTARAVRVGARVARVRAEYPNQLVYSGFERVRKFTKYKPIARASWRLEARDLLIREEI